MLGLGIESTAHTFSCAIIEKKGKKGKILSDVRKIFRPEAGEGIHPREASRHHIENSSSVLSQCLKESDVDVPSGKMPSISPLFKAFFAWTKASLIKSSFFMRLN